MTGLYFISLITLVLMIPTELYSEPCQTSNMEDFGIDFISMLYMKQYYWIHV